MCASDAGGGRRGAGVMKLELIALLMLTGCSSSVTPVVRSVTPLQGGAIKVETCTITLDTAFIVFLRPEGKPLKWDGCKTEIVQPVGGT